MDFYYGKFRELRKKKHISVNYIASNLNVSPVALWRWENGKNKPNENTIRSLSNLTGIRLIDISDLKEEARLSNLSPGDVSAAITEPILFNSQNIKGAYDSVLNILVHLKKKSEQSASLLKLLLNSNNVIFYIKDIKLNYIVVNDIFLKTLSKSSDCIYAGKNDSVFFTIEEAKRNTSEDEQVLLTGIAIENKEDFIPGTRRKQIGLISKFPIFDDAGMIIGVAATFIDITRRVSNENKNIILSEIVQKLPFGISVCSSEPHLKGPFFANSIFKTFGVPDINILIRSPELIVKHIKPCDVNEFAEFINQHKCPSSVSIRLYDESGRNERWIKYSVYQIDKYNITTIEDISLEKEREEINEVLKIYIKVLNKGVRIFDFKTRQFLYVNETVEKLYGRKADEFYKGGEDFWLNKCLHPDDRKRIEECDIENLDIVKYYKSKPVNQYRIITQCGKIKHISCENTAIMFKNDHYTLHVETEITEGNKKNEGF